jgi:hypothetical protein
VIGLNAAVETIAIVPEPDPEERAAILAAVAEREPRPRGEWGRPDVGDEDAYGEATAPRRKSDGATRA